MEKWMFERLDFLISKHEELGMKISDPSVIEDQNLWQKLMKEHADISPLVEKYKEYKNLLNGLEEAKEILADGSDEEMKEMAKEELSALQPKIEDAEYEMKIMMLPKDPNDERDVIFEVRAGAGGDEAGLFAAEILRMYMRYAESKRWKIETLNTSENGIGGIKEASVLIKGKGAYSRLKFESGTHRVQRVPQTESGGRIHTSTCTVAVLPDVDDVEVEIKPQDIRVDVFRSSGNGGQSVNTTDSAVRITHLETGLVVSCQDGKSQLSNKEKALQVLKARLYERELQKQNDEIAAQRRSQVGSGDRSAKIRTYNFPQSRVTDHRVPVTYYKLDQYMQGEIDEMIDSVVTFFQSQALSELERV